MGSVSPSLVVDAHIAGRSYVVAPLGELERATADALGGAITRAPSACRRWVIDLRGVTFLDCGGIRLIMETMRLAEQRGVGFALVPGPRPLQRVLKAAGVDAHLTFIDDPRQAVGG